MSTKPTGKPTGMTSMFNLGYGTNHLHMRRQRRGLRHPPNGQWKSAGRRTFSNTDIKQLEVVGRDGGAAKRKRHQGESAAKQPKVSKEEAEALARRAAAR